MLDRGGKAQPRTSPLSRTLGLVVLPVPNIRAFVKGGFERCLIICCSRGLGRMLCSAVATQSQMRYGTWWFRSSSQVYVDGIRGGFLHVNWEHSAVIITRTDLRPSQSYLVGLSGTKFLTHCGDWEAPRLPAFSIGDGNPPSSFFSNGSDLPMADNAVLSTLTARPGFVEFQTAHGKKVSVSW